MFNYLVRFKNIRGNNAGKETTVAFRNKAAFVEWFVPELQQYLEVLGQIDGDALAPDPDPESDFATRMRELANDMVKPEERIYPIEGGHRVPRCGSM